MNRTQHDALFLVVLLRYSSSADTKDERVMLLESWLQMEQQARTPLHRRATRYLCGMRGNGGVSHAHVASVVFCTVQGMACMFALPRLHHRV